MKKYIPTRILIQLVNSLPKDLIQEISPKSLRLHRFVKVPLVFMTWSAGLLVATNLSIGKALGEIVFRFEFWRMPIFSSSLFFAGCLVSGLVAYTISISMRYYDNIDVIPMFQSFILLMMLAAGWTILNEIQFY